MNKTEQICGIVERVTFSSSDTGYAVIEVEDGGELVTAVGNMPGVAEGQEVELLGEYVTHPTYGLQFKAESYVCRMPQGEAAVLKYLSSKTLPGIGPVLARRIVEAFGSETLTVIEKQPERLARVKGMTLEKAVRAQQEFCRQFGAKEAIAALAQLGLDAQTALQLYKEYGTETVERVQNNPYLLCLPPAEFAFGQADDVAQLLQFEKDCECRVLAGVRYVLDHNTLNGHCCLPKAKLLPTASRYLDVPAERVQEVIDRALADGNLAAWQPPEQEEFLFLPEYFRAEMYVAGHLKTLQALCRPEPVNPDKLIGLLEQKWGIRYAPAQRQAIETALSHSCMVLTGGPGTGKTTTINAMIELFEEQGLKVALAAPTGRAAKRMSEVCGREAKTIHRLLEVSYGSRNSQLRFVHNEKNPLRCQVVILDEVSMVDLLLFESLLRALSPTCRIILVGDCDQLPSVGAGNLLRDMIDCGKIPTVSLKDIFRQAAQSRIIRVAHQIVEGQLPGANERQGDFFFLERPAAAASSLVGELVGERLPAAYGFDPVRDIQVLCPSKLGQCGTQLLNERLQQLLNPPSPDKPQLVFMGNVYRLGDKVMQVRNNYDIEYTKPDAEHGTGAFNGDLGVITKVDPRTQSLTVQMDDRSYLYKGENLRQLEIAYAITIHKAQGSEFPCVVLPCAQDTPLKLCYRNLLYTGVTRAKKLLCMVGSFRTFAAMVENNRRVLRYSCLVELMQDDSIC